MNETDCHLANGTFYYVSSTEEDCLRHLYCWSPQSIITGLKSPVDSDGNCPGGVSPQSLFKWEAPKWIGGTWASSQWTSRQPVHANAIANTIDFKSLQSNVSLASTFSLKVALQNQVDQKREGERGERNIERAVHARFSDLFISST